MRTILVVGVLACAAGWAFQNDARIAAGPQLIREGRLEQALEVYRTAAASTPASLAANNGAGVVLDLLGQYEEARKYFTQAHKAAANLVEKAQQQRAMAVSYAFAHDCKGAEKADRAAYNEYLAMSDFRDAGETANELGRICLEAGDGNTARDWYEKGHAAGLQEPELKPDRQSLWEFRWAHARARIAVRSGKTEEARKYVRVARAILDRGRIADQQTYFDSLTGYVAFYSGEYEAALADLQKVEEKDAFIQSLIAQTYEKMGDRANALAYYRRAAAATAHSVPAAFGRTLAKSKLE